MVELHRVEGMRGDDQLTMRSEAIEALRKLATNTDGEAAHSGADEVLRELLIALGYQDVIEEYDRVTRWFA